MTPAETIAAIAATGQLHRTPCGEGEMVWRSFGSGPVLVLLHGGAGSWMHWLRAIPALSRQHRLLVPDLPGLGESAQPPLPASPEGIADALATGIEALLPAGEGYDLCGFSFGAMLSCFLCLRHASRIRRLVVVGAGGLVPFKGAFPLQKVRGKQGAEKMAAHRHNLLCMMIGRPEGVDDLALAIQDWNSEHARLDSRGFAARGAIREAMPQVGVPVGAIWGELDQLPYHGLQDRIDALRALQPQADIRTIPDGGHWIAYEASAAFTAMLQDMLKAK